MWFTTKYLESMTLFKSIAWYSRSKTNKYTMKNILHKKNWNTGTVQVHVETPIITIIEGKKNEKSDKDFVRLNRAGIQRHKI